MAEDMYREDWKVAANWKAEAERLRDRLARAEAALTFYAEEDSEPEVGGVDGGRTALAYFDSSKGRTVSHDRAEIIEVLDAAGESSAIRVLRARFGDES